MRPRLFSLTLPLPLHAHSAAMSSDALARAEGFYSKAEELVRKGHLQRAAENYGRAAEAARALGADSLVAVDTRMRQAAIISTFATAGTHRMTDPQIRAAREGTLLLSGAVEALDRRRVAGTLLPGKCSAFEEEWRANSLKREAARENTPFLAADNTFADDFKDDFAELASLIGHELQLLCASDVLTVLRNVHRYGKPCAPTRSCSPSLSLLCTPPIS